jgi:TPR repeat protein
MEPNEDQSLVLRQSDELITRLTLGNRILDEMVTRSLALARETAPLNVGLDAIVQEAKRIQRKQGMTAEDIRAFELFYRAATAGHAEAQCHVSSCYALGNGVQKNTKKALKWLQRSAEQISRCRAIRLRVFFAVGLTDFSQDYVEAANWYRYAADQGNAPEQFEIGESYRKGIVVPQDYYEAAQWYHKAAKQGYADAQYKLALYFRGGEEDGFYEHVAVELSNYFFVERRFQNPSFDVPFDVLNAKTGQIIIAANQPITKPLLRKLARDYDRSGIAPSPVRDKLQEIIAKLDKGAIVWFQRAAEQGHAVAERNLALCKDSTSSFTEKNSAVG